jgi:DNA repair protein RecO (recombination protein O)
MNWQDEGYLLAKNNYNENSIIIDVFSFNHGRCSGIVYGGNSRKIKKDFQIGNKIFINFKSKSENKIGYFTAELIKPISPFFFDDKKRSIGILSASSILKILLPERQLNKKIYSSFESLLEKFPDENWINSYIFWELSLVKELGFDISLKDDFDNLSTKKNNILINNKSFKIPQLIMNNVDKNVSQSSIKEALVFNKNLLMENFIFPNKIRFPLSRNILEKYFN